MLLLDEVGPRKPQRLAPGWEPEPYHHLTLQPLSPVIGVEVEGIDLRDPISPAVFAELHQALLEWKVLFFRDQPITSEQHRAFAARWGRLETHPFLPEGDAPEVVRFERDADNVSYENTWHSDVTWREVPSLGSVLRAIEVPELGGDTLFADMGAAYDGLPDSIKERIDGLEAMHDFSQSFGLLLTAEELATMQERYPAVAHPVVRTHPETSRKTLFVNRFFTDHIVGLDADESRALLQYLFHQAEIPEYQCRFHWAENSIAFWDNRATQHYAASDYWPNRRVVERATIVGDRPY